MWKRHLDDDVASACCVSESAMRHTTNGEGGSMGWARAVVRTQEPEERERAAKEDRCGDRN